MKLVQCYATLCFLPSTIWPGVQPPEGLKSSDLHLYPQNVALGCRSFLPPILLH